MIVPPPVLVIAHGLPDLTAIHSMSAWLRQPGPVTLTITS